MTDFNAMSADWDKDSMKVERARKVADVISRTVQLTKNTEALEYGCGTGLLSFNLYQQVKHIDMLDTSDGMLVVLKEKITKFGIANMTTAKLDLTQGVGKDKKYDLIYTLMTLHHIADVEGMLKTFHGMLKPSGVLCIADLDKEDGSFHSEEEFDGHNGFQREDLETKMKRADLKVFHYESCYEIDKVFKNGSSRKYPMFVMEARRPPSP